MLLTDIGQLLGSFPSGPEVGTAQVTGVIADSRQAQPGTVFVAVRGAAVDGHAYITRAIEGGCIAVVAETVPEHLPVPCFSVSDSHAALGTLAAAWYEFPAAHMHCIGITGTNGKTTTSWLLEKILQQAGCQTGVIGTVNYRYQDGSGNAVVHKASLTTPDPLHLQALLREMADNGVSHVIIEASSHALMQKRLAHIDFEVALFTNLSRDHLDYHGDMTTYFETKQLLFSSCLRENGTAVVVMDSRTGEEKYARRLVDGMQKKNILTVGLSGEWTIHAEHIRQRLQGMTCTFVIKGKPVQIQTSLTGVHNVLNMLGAAGIAHSLGFSAKQIQSGLAAVRQVPGRLERVSLAGTAAENQPAVFVDYAHTPDGLENVLAFLREMTSGRLFCVVGCGGDRDAGKRSLMGNIAAGLADVVIFTSDNPRGEKPEDILSAMESGVQQTDKKFVAAKDMMANDAPEHGYLMEVDRKKAIHLACVLAQPGDVVLIAGKGHEQYQIHGQQRIFFDDRVEVKNGLSRWTVPHLLAATGGRLEKTDSHPMLGTISTDTRTIADGDIFLALRGDHFDGHAFVQNALDRGAKAIIVEEVPAELLGQVPVVIVTDTLTALGDLARYRRTLLAEGLKVIGITGSSGKTTLKEMTAAIFEQFYGQDGQTGAVLKTQGNFNNMIGLPLSLLPLTAQHKVAILEMGMNNPGEILRLTEIGDPDIGCINNIQEAHLQGLGDISGVAAAKGELFAGLRRQGIRVVNYDDRNVVNQAEKYPGEKIGYAITPAGRRRDPEVRVTRVIGLGERGNRFTLHIGPWHERITMTAPGIHNVHNAAAATAIAHAAGVDTKSIVQGLTRFRTVDKRMQFMQLPSGLQVLNDCYNANPASMAASLRTVATFGSSGCRRIAALGDMLELGAQSAAAHREVGRLVANLGFDFLVVTGSMRGEVAAGAVGAEMAAENIMTCTDILAVADWLYHLVISGRLRQDDWLLVKGSRGMRMEHLLTELQNRFAPVRCER